jgi:hypothetical protein
MSSDTHQIDVHRIDINIDLPQSLSRISMEKYLSIPTDLPYLFNILSNPNFIMNKDNTDT